MIEMRDLLAENKILEERWAAEPGLERALVVCNANALVRRQHLPFGIGAELIELARIMVLPGLRRAARLCRMLLFGERAPYGAWIGRRTMCPFRRPRRFFAVIMREGFVMNHR